MNEHTLFVLVYQKYSGCFPYLKCPESLLSSFIPGQYLLNYTIHSLVKSLVTSIGLFNSSAFVF